MSGCASAFGHPRRRVACGVEREAWSVKQRPGTGWGPSTFPGCQKVGGLFRCLNSGFLYFSLPHARSVPVKSWPCTSWFGQWSPDPPSSATAGLPVPNRWRVTWRPPVSRTAWSGDPRRTKSHPGSGRMLGFLDVLNWRDVASVCSSSQKPLCGLDLNPVNRIFPGCVSGPDGLQ